MIAQEGDVRRAALACRVLDGDNSPDARGPEGDIIVDHFLCGDTGTKQHVIAVAAARQLIVAGTAA